MFGLTSKAALLSLIALTLLGSRAAAVDIEVTSIADAGAGTLREAIGTAVEGDRIVFNIPGMPTITLLSDLPIIPEDISFSNSGSVLIDRNGNAALQFAGSLVDPTELMINTGGVPSADDDITGDAATTIIGDGTVDGNVRIPGTLAPGSSDSLDSTIGTFTVNGDLDLTDAVVRVGLFSDGVTTANDLIVVNGTLDVTDADIFPALSGGEFTPGQTFLLIDSTNPIVGTFANLPEVLEILDLPFLRLVEDAALGADDFGVIVQDNGAAFSSIASGLNQTAAAELVDSLLGGSAALAALRNGSTNEALAAVDQLSGSIYPSLIGAEINHIQSNLGSVRDRLISPSRSRCCDPSLNHWVRGYGLSGEVDQDQQGSRGYRHELAGVEIGLGLLRNGPWAVHGFANFASGDLETRGVDQRADIDSYRIGGSVEWIGQNGYMLVAGGAGVQEYDVLRSLTALEGSTFAASSFDGSSQFGYVELGSSFSRFTAQWTPFLALNSASVELDPIAETGDPDFALSNAGGSGESLRGSLGLSIDKSGATPLGMATTRLRFGWLHEFLDESETFVSDVAAGGTLVDRGVSAGRDWAFARVQLDMGQFLGGQLSVAYQGHFNRHSSFNSLVAGTHWAF